MYPFWRDFIGGIRTLTLTYLINKYIKGIKPNEEVLSSLEYIYQADTKLRLFEVDKENIFPRFSLLGANFQLIRQFLSKGHMSTICSKNSITNSFDYMLLEWV